jgi:class 3 adenylate cyclase
MVGTLYLGPMVALAWGLTVFGAFTGFFGVALPWAAAYGSLYAAATLLAVAALKRFGDVNPLEQPAKSLIGWYLVIGLAAPVATTLIGVPMLVAGGGAAESAEMFLLMLSNYISDSFSPISLGFGLFAVVAAAVSPRAEAGARTRAEIVERLLWLALVGLAALAIVPFGDRWTRQGINDMTPAFYLLLAWAALRFSLPFAMAATAGVGLLVTSCLTFGLGGTPVPATTEDALVAFANLLALTVLAQISSVMTLQRKMDEKRAMAAELDRAHLKRYFSPRIVDELLQQSDTVDRTRSQRVVVMFVDIVSFTAIAETQTPEGTIAMLREFDTAMEGAIFDNNGVVDKYIGDGVMAAFGLPRVGEADVASAVRCARAMAAKTAQLAAKRQSEGEEPYSIGIGLHYGDVVAGNVGSERNLSFTVIGDTVNTASRLETLSRELDARIVVSDEVVEAVRNEIGDDAAELLSGFKRIGEKPVKGRRGAVGVWVLPRDYPIPSL